MFSPRDFYPVNDGVNQKMVRTALARLDIQPQDRVLDLFLRYGQFHPAAGQSGGERGGRRRRTRAGGKGAGKMPPSMNCRT